MQTIRIMFESLIVRAEQKFKTDVRYLLRGGFWLGAAQVIASGSAFLVAIAFANLLPKEIYGAYKYVLSVVGVLVVTTLTGMDSAMTQASARGFDGALLSGIKAKVRWGMLGGLSLIVLAAYYYLHGNMVLAGGLAVTAIFFPFDEGIDALNSFLTGKKLFGIQTRYLMIKKLIGLAAVVLAIVLTHDLTVILLAYFASSVLPNGIFLYRIAKRDRENDQHDPQMITYGKRLSMIYAASAVLDKLDALLLFHFVGAADLAIYALATAPNDQIKGLFKNLNTLALPQFSKYSAEEIKKSIFRKLAVVVLISALIVGAYIVLAPIFFAIFFPKYLASVHYSQILALSLIGITGAAFLYAVLESQRAQKELLHYNVAGNIVSLVVLFPLVYFYGIWGAVAARLASRFTFMFLAIFLVKRLR